jgi:hypothetical protein
LFEIAEVHNLHGEHPETPHHIRIAGAHTTTSRPATFLPFPAINQLTFEVKDTRSIPSVPGSTEETRSAKSRFEEKLLKVDPGRHEFDEKLTEFDEKRNEFVEKRHEFDASEFFDRFYSSGWNDTDVKVMTSSEPTGPLTSQESAANRNDVETPLTSEIFGRHNFADLLDLSQSRSGSSGFDGVFTAEADDNSDHFESRADVFPPEVPDFLRYAVPMKVPVDRKMDFFQPSYAKAKFH